MLVLRRARRGFFFFFNDTATTEIYTLSLHDALPIFAAAWLRTRHTGGIGRTLAGNKDRKSTRLNSSHVKISYAVFCLKKKQNKSRCDSLVETTQHFQGQSLLAIIR